jgi:hypothetical protein
MNLNVKKVLPDETSTFTGFPIVRILTALFLLVVVARSCIHLFAEDGGANSIAGIDISVAGGGNIVAIFHQWGAIQLLLASLLVLLFFRYPGLTPLILLTLALDPVLRSIAGAIAPITVEGTPPGESLNWPAFIVVFSLFLASLVEKDRKKS